MRLTVRSGLTVIGVVRLTGVLSTLPPLRGAADGARSGREIGVEVGVVTCRILSPRAPEIGLSMTTLNPV